MDSSELKMTVARYLSEGVSLSDIQAKLDADHHYKIKFFDLRMLAAELENVDWEQFSPKKKEPAPESEIVPESPSAGNGQTLVTVSKLVRPGMAASGSVTFASGATADWYVDSYGRPGLENPVGQPTEEDVKLFMPELQKVLTPGY